MDEEKSVGDALLDMAYDGVSGTAGTVVGGAVTAAVGTPAAGVVAGFFAARGLFKFFKAAEKEARENPDAAWGQVG